MTPSTDFYKKLALDCSGQQVAVDLFLLSGQYADLASLGKFFLVIIFLRGKSKWYFYDDTDDKVKEFLFPWEVSLVYN